MILGQQQKGRAMPTVFYPIAMALLRYGGAAAAGYALAKGASISQGDMDLRRQNNAEDRLHAAFDAAPEGVGLAPTKNGALAQGRWRRRVRIGGRNAALDAGLFARIAVRWS